MSPRTQEANEALHDERRKTILDMALGVFVAKGFEGTRMKEIADRCAMSYGLVYHYFPTKEAVFTALVEMALASAKMLIHSLPHGSPPKVVGDFVGFAVSGSSPLYFALIVEALTKQGVPPELAAKARETIISFKDSLAEVCGSNNPGSTYARAEAVLAILIGASIMKICTVTDGHFASGAVTILASSDRA